MSQRHTESISSYVAGFVLSVICTIIPYYLVVNKTVTGNNLLATIVGFATLQVLIQVYFFLHLGRGPKPLYNVIFFGATVGIIMMVVGGSLLIMHNLHYNMLPPADTVKQLAEGEGIAQVEGKKTGACETIKTNHQVNLEPSMGAITPSRTTAQLCDTISFVNHDSMSREISFGTPAKPATYAGQTKITIRKGMSETITLNQAGSYLFYDIMTPELTGSLTVSQP